MGRGTAKTSVDRFSQVFGTRRGKMGEQDAFAGRKTPAAGEYITQLGMSAKTGDVDEALALLRERGLDDSLVAPLVEGITVYARKRALDSDWLGAVQRFAHLSYLQGPVDSVWKVFDERQYKEVLAQHLASEMERGISHLRSKDDINRWLVLCAVQGTLIELTSDLLMSPAGERILKSSLGKERYEEFFSWTHVNGLDGVHALIDRNELSKSLSHLLPSEAGLYAIRDELKFAFNPYDMAVACGLAGLQSK